MYTQLLANILTCINLLCMQKIINNNNNQVKRLKCNAQWWAVHLVAGPSVGTSFNLILKAGWLKKQPHG